MVVADHDGEIVRVMKVFFGIEKVGAPSGSILARFDLHFEGTFLADMVSRLGGREHFFSILVIIQGHNGIAPSGCGGEQKKQQLKGRRPWTNSSGISESDSRPTPSSGPSNHHDHAAALQRGRRGFAP